MQTTAARILVQTCFNANSVFALILKRPTVNSAWSEVSLAQGTSKTCLQRYQITALLYLRETFTPRHICTLFQVSHGFVSSILI